MISVSGPYLQSKHSDSQVGYLIEVPMGTPAQNFLILADTGSGDTWVHST